MEIIRDDAFTIARMPGDMAPSPHLYLTNCVLSGPYYTVNGRPAYLQADPESNILRIVGGHQGLALNFALGKDGPYMANKTVRHYGVTALRVPEDGANKSFWVWAELSENDRITFGLEDTALYEVTHSYKEPTSPKQGDYWFDMEANEMKRWNSQVPAWQPVRRIIIGKIGVGSDGNIYSMTSYPFRKDFAELHPEYINYDGVDFVTGGEFTAEHFDKWKENPTVVENVLNNYQAFRALVQSSKAKDAADRLASDIHYRTMLLGNPFTETFVWGKEPYQTVPYFVESLFNKGEKSTYVSLAATRPNGYAGTSSILVRGGSSSNENTVYYRIQIDVTKYNTLTIHTRAEDSEITNRLIIKLGNTTLVNEAYSNTNWTKRTFNISNYTGVQMLLLHSKGSYVSPYGSYFFGITLSQ